MDIKVDSDSVVVFDLDDTLYNELDYLRSAYIEIAKNLLPDEWQGLFSKMISLYRNQKNVFEFLSEKYPTSVEELISRYRNHHPQISPFEGVHQLLRDIKNKNGEIAIVTDGRTTTQNRKIEALGIKPQIDLIITSEEIGTEKPDEK